MEIDMPEFGGWDRILWGGATVSYGGGTRIDDGGGWADINSHIRDGNWHTVGMKRLSGNYCLYIDGVQQDTYNHGIYGNYIDGTQIEVQPGVMYPYGTNTVFHVIAWYAGSNGSYYCPDHNTDSTMQYVHIYHP